MLQHVKIMFLKKEFHYNFTEYHLYNCQTHSNGFYKTIKKWCHRHRWQHFRQRDKITPISFSDSEKLPGYEIPLDFYCTMVGRK